jgi:type IV pilus assembly protein PilX
MDMSLPGLPHLEMAHPQRGAALITALLLLVVLTILGMSVMQMSRVQEKMAGNTRDINVSFESAEGALRNAEALIAKQSSRPVACPDTSCPFRALSSVPDVSNQSKDWWSSNGQAFADAGGNPMSGVSDNPRYVIEEIAQVAPIPDPTNPQPGRTFYQVTARSTGASGLANTIVQSTYARKY